MSLYRDLYITYASFHVQLVIFRWFGGEVGAESATCCLSPQQIPLSTPFLPCGHIGILTGWLLRTLLGPHAANVHHEYGLLSVLSSFPPVRPSVCLSFCSSVCLSAACQLHFSHDAAFSVCFWGSFPALLCNAFCVLIYCKSRREGGATATSTATLAAQHMRVCARFVLHLFAVNFESGRQHTDRV